jgi:hypothetical protein
MLKAPLLVAPYILNHKGRYISVPLAVVISPRSRIFLSAQPNDCKTSFTFSLASVSFPLMNVLWSPPFIIAGFTIKPHHIVFKAFTTLAAGNAFCISSANEFVFATDNVGGIPLLKSSGLAMSIMILPFKLFSPASFNASKEPPPAVQLKMISPNAAASANDPRLALSKCLATNALPFSLLGCSGTHPNGMPQFY